MLLLLLSFAFPAPAPAAPLPTGLCPFEPVAAKKLFAADLVNDLGWAEIEKGFRKRERWYGACKESAAEGRGQWRMKHAEGSVLLEVKIKGGRIQEYSFGLGEVAGDDWEKLAAFTGRHWRRSSLFVSQDNRKLAGHREAEPLSVGENAQVFLLAAVENALRAGKLQPGQKVKVTRAKVADPMDALAEREGSEVTVKELKDLMLSHQDRTAADLLLELVGRSAVESEARGLAPLLSRREAAWLYTLSPAEMKKVTHETAPAAAQRLNQAAKVPPLPKERYDAQAAVAWPAATEDVCRALMGVRTMPELRNSFASQGFREGTKMASGVYLGNRDFGLAQTSWVVAKTARGPATCFSLTILQDSSLDEADLDEVTGRAKRLTGL